MVFLSVLTHIIYFQYSMNRISLFYRGVETYPTQIKLLYVYTFSELSLGWIYPASRDAYSWTIVPEIRKQTSSHSSGPCGISPEIIDVPLISESTISLCLCYQLICLQCSFVTTQK